MGERFQIWPRQVWVAHRAAQLELARAGLPALRAQQRGQKTMAGGA
jgi:MraZ protein